MATAAPVYDQLVCFGDSQTQYGFGPGGFVASLAHAYQRRFDVICRGYSGYTTDQGVALAPQIFQSLPPGAPRLGVGRIQLVVLWLGTNDAVSPGFPQHVPVERTASNLRAILDTISSLSSAEGVVGGPTRVLLLTPAAVVPHRNPGRTDNAQVRRYADAVLSVARDYAASAAAVATEEQGGKLQLASLDALQLFLDDAAGNEEALASLLLEDGLHISSKGYQLLYKGIMDTIERAFPDIAPSQVALRGPIWRDVVTLDVEEQKERVRL